MQVTVKLLGKLRHSMPAGNSSGNYPIIFQAGDSLQQILDRLSLPEGKPFLVLHNDNKIDSKDYTTLVVEESDDIILLTPMKGG